MGTEKSINRRNETVNRAMREKKNNTICMELNRIVCKLIKDIQLQNFHLHQEKRQHYRDVVRIMMGLEDSLSLIIFGLLQLLQRVFQRNHSAVVPSRNECQTSYSGS
ncbi:hypothetical protein CEXT_90361 [Caerostris extrusa]|uniref:Uncharacterized protein n=1 Tax=Caerostris extrusa TaxID=172846 RepID=A0AAV4Y554_CAEEX|nr:hypothetical protein CEXT_90361 [Caerostris extrusa]